jgi:hypothetical protein
LVPSTFQPVFIQKTLYSACVHSLCVKSSSRLRSAIVKSLLASTAWTNVSSESRKSYRVSISLCLCFIQFVECAQSNQHSMSNINCSYARVVQTLHKGDDKKNRSPFSLDISKTVWAI